MSETAIAEVTEPTNALAIAQSDIDPADLDIPRINVIQKMSESDHPTGAIVYDKRCILADAETPLKVIPVAAQKGWRENIPFEEDEVPRIVWTKEAAEELESDSDWGTIEFAEITLLVEKPEDCEDDEAYQLPIGDKDYAIGKINVAKTAYRSTYKRLVTFAAFNAGTPVTSKVWSFVSEPYSKGKYTWFNPSLTSTKEDAPEAVVAFASKFQ